MQKRYIPLLLFFALFLILLAHFTGRVTAVPVFTRAEQEKQVYLTFDDGPSTVVTNSILNVLERENVKATFFIVSDRVKGREEILRRAAKNGHTLGVHSATHEYADIYRSPEALLQDIDECAAVIKEVTGITPDVYRFPGGNFKRRELRAVVENHGYRIIDWNAVCGDEEIRGATAETLLSRTRETAAGKNSVVLLLHDSPPHRATAEALPAIIRYFKEQGFCFCTF